MAGIVGEPPKQVSSSAPAPGGDDPMSPDAIMAAMHLSDEQRDPLMRIVAAGKKILYSKQTHPMMVEAMQGEGPTEKKLADGIIGLIGLLWGESKGSLPPQLIIPAAMVLMADAADFMRQAGEEVTPEQFGMANELLIDGLLKQGGVDPEKLAGVAGGQAGGPSMSAAPAEGAMA